MKKIGIIGLGRLGLSFALNLERIGYEIVGVDINPKLIQAINDKTLKTFEPFVSELLVSSTKLRASTNFSDLAEVNQVLCFVATPSNNDGSFNHEQIDNAIHQLLKIKGDTTIDFVVCCTTMPGYCEHLQESVRKHNINILYNPEFIAQGSIINDQLNPDQILIGCERPEQADFLVKIYQDLVQSQPNYHIISRTEAEIAKLSTNCFLTMKIAFANALGDACKKWNVTPQNVLNAIGSDSRIGNKYLKYGYGFGGPCFPRDNKALIHATNEIGIDFSFSKATIKENTKHFEFQTNDLLQQEDKIYFESIGYKNGSDIIEESQQLRIALALVQKGKRVILNKNDKARKIIEEKYPGVFEFE